MTPGLRDADVESQPPLVSIVMATYNRSNIIGFAIESVRWQTLTDWELWVVGDACTDDTEAVVAAFADPRIHFLNLPVNIGEQSGPNNEGVARARGRYLAFLNHDDLWLPDHLSTMVQGLETHGADLVFTAALRLSPKGEWRWLTWPVNKKRAFRPEMVVPASLWVLRRELAASVGPWRGYRECYGSPSHDWMFRAARAGAHLVHLPCLTAIKCTGDAGNYSEGHADHNRRVFERVRGEPDFRERVVTALLLESRARDEVVQSSGLLEDVIMLGRRLADVLQGRGGQLRHKGFSPRGNRAIAAVGLDPVAVGYWVRFGRKGAKIENLRAKRGLAAVPGQDIAS